MSFFKKSLTALLGLAFLVSQAPRVVQASDGPNLIANPSMELTLTAKADAPAGWVHNAWGNNSATFTYVKSGAQDGSRSVKVDVQNYVDGDAKWYFNPVNVTAGGVYGFADYYKATTTTEVVADAQLTDGTDTYLWMGELAPATNWKRAAYLVTAPANVKKMTVFHLIGANGTLQIDNTLLSLQGAPQIVDNVPNPSLEENNILNLQPKAWSQGKWGTNTAAFSIVSGHTGKQAAQVQMRKYTDGDAKWIYDAQPIVPNGTYEFSDWYKSTVATQVVAQVTLTDGTTQYLSLAPAPAASTWTHYVNRITMPYNAANVTVFQLIASVGTLTTDDYSFTRVNPTGFTQGLISFTFDDGWDSFASGAEPILNNAGVHATAYLISGMLGTPDYLTPDQVWGLAAAGHEIGDHTITHPHLTTLTTDQIQQEMVGAQTALQAYGQPVRNFASPYGEYDDRVLSIARQYFHSHRGVETGFNTADAFNAYDLKVQDVDRTTTVAQVNAWITQAKADKSWLILVYHQIDDTTADYGTSPANLQAEVAAAQASGLPIDTVDQALTAIGH